MRFASLILVGLVIKLSSELSMHRPRGGGQDDEESVLT
jgi:hypothetical protein